MAARGAAAAPRWRPGWPARPGPRPLRTVAGAQGASKLNRGQGVSSSLCWAQVDVGPLAPCSSCSHTRSKLRSSPTFAAGPAGGRAFHLLLPLRRRTARPCSRGRADGRVRLPGPPCGVQQQRRRPGRRVAFRRRGTLAGRAAGHAVPAGRPAQGPPTPSRLACCRRRAEAGCAGWRRRHRLPAHRLMAPPQPPGRQSCGAGEGAAGASRPFEVLTPTQHAQNGRERPEWLTRQGMGPFLAVVGRPGVARCEVS